MFKNLGKHKPLYNTIYCLLDHQIITKHHQMPQIVYSKTLKFTRLGDIRPFGTQPFYLINKKPNYLYLVQQIK